jgi:hypothetical protein
MNSLRSAVLLLLAGVAIVRGDATLVFNEIHYHPATNEPAMEWVELYNQLAVDLDVSGWRLDGDIGYTFPPNSRVRGRGFVVVAINPAAFTAATGVTNVVGPFTNRLSNGGGTLLIHNNNGRLIDELSYETEGAWPVAPDGAGPSLAKLDEDSGSANPANWLASASMGGSPGAFNVPRATSTTVERTLVPLNQTWKYDQSGNDLGTAWKEPAYDDTAWASGAGVFGLENNATVRPLTNTVLSLTNSNGQRVITYYFRTHFTFTNNPAEYFLTANNLLDDGVVVYLNGAEIYRYRVPAGQNFQTLAQNQPSEGAFELITLPATALVQGDNVIAAEVHQVNTGSTDVVFGLELKDGQTITHTPPGGSVTNIPVAINEVSSVTNGQFWVEFVNLSDEPVSLENCVLARFGSPSDREYVVPAATIPARGYFVLDRATLGFGADPGDRIVLYAPGKAAVVDATVAKSEPRARLPQGTGNWLLPSAPTPEATNQFALHDTIVINEIMYRHQPFPSVDGQPAQDNPEEWIELFNRGTSAVNLTGWALKGGVDYLFPSGKILAPGAYLVIAKDAAALRLTYPGVDIVGNFDGNLSSDGEILRIEDANGNPADEVHYYSDGRWPESARGGGSSLELRDPASDNSKAEAWAASDESGRSSWQTYSYRMVAQPSVAPNTDNPWREFVLGLLARGEVLIDDITVLQSPTNNPVSLVANGDFENGRAGWRFLGTHHASEVIDEPGHSGNKVLRIVASGTQEHMNNQINTTLANGQSVINGQLYEISYRAKWITGSRLLNTRLWFNRVARSTELVAPQNNGTPGAINSRFTANIGPTFSRLRHEPAVPAAGSPVTISVQAHDPQSVTNCRVFWSVNGGMFSNAPMALQANGDFSASLPGSAAGAVVQFYVQATDGLGATATFPARGANGGTFYQVNDGQANVSLTHNFRIITTPAHAALLHAATNVMSNDNLPCTVIYDERIAYYDVGLRLKGSMNGRPSAARVGYHLAFQPEQLFRDVHPTMGMDRRPGDNLPRNEEIVVRHAALAAGGIPSMQMDICRVLGPAGSAYSGPAILTPSYEDDFIQTAFENGGDGTLFELDGIYLATTANADGYKLPQPNNSGNYVDVTDHGPDKETYRYHFIIKNHRAQDDYGQLMAFARPFALTGAALEAQTRQMMDLDQWLRAYALITLFGVNDTYTFWLNHNVMFYIRPEDHKAVYLMWDSDFAFGRSATDVIVGTQNLGKIINLPSNLRVLYAQLLDLMATHYNTGYMSYWLAHYGPLSSANYTPRLSYIQQRSDYVKSVIASAGGNAPFTVTSTNVTVNGSNVVTLSGTAPVQVRTITINGVAWPVTWTSLTGWTLRLPVEGGMNTFQIAGQDLRGNFVTNTSYTAHAMVNATSEPPEGRIVFNEIMFHAGVPEGEYVEFYNRSTNTTYDLSGWRVNGINYTFPAGSYLAPRSYLVLAKNRSVFAATYGGITALFDEFDGELQANGETLSLIKPGATPGEDTIVDRVRYEGGLPWPIAADGTGSSFQLIDHGQDNSRAGNWTARHVPAVYQDGVFIPATTNTGWRFVSFTGSIGSGVGGGQQRLLIYLAETNGASALIDDLSLVAGTNATQGANYIRNGGFESSPLLENPALTNSWVVNVNYTNTLITSALTHSGQGALRIEATTFGNSFGRVVSQNLSPAPPAGSVNTLSFWFYSTNSATNLIVRIQNSAALTTGNSGTNILPSITPETFIPPKLISAETNYLTPGAANQFTATLPAFPTLWINEVQPEHTGGHLDNQGEPDPWIELFNAGTNVVSLDGLFLSGTYTNLTNWAFPAGHTIGPGQFLVVFCDGEPSETSGTQLHTSFRLPPAGSVALSRLHNGQPQVIDYVNYAVSPADRSYGSYPDGQPFDRWQFFYVTPGAPNDGRPAPEVVFINEWLASNSEILADPADGDFNDWFELYNPGANPVNLAGYYLTDSLSNPLQYRITTNGPHVIPPGGHLLVWADNEPGQNMVDGVPRTDLHVSFQLGAGGEAIGLFAPDGTQIDAVTFGPQTEDVSAGRYPDGSANIVPMPGTVSPRAANFLAGSHPPITFGGWAHEGGALTLRWNTQAGRLYTIEFTDDLSAPAWTSIWAAAASGPSLSFTNFTTNSAQRFFRIRLEGNP